MKVLRGCKPTLLIELAVVWQECFWNNAQHLATLYDNSTIEQKSSDSNRSTNDNDDIQLTRKLHQLHYRHLCSVDEEFLAKQILTRITRYREFREDNYLHPHALGTDYHLLYLRNIIVAIADLHRRYRGSNLYIAVIIHSLMVLK